MYIACIVEIKRVNPFRIVRTVCSYIILFMPVLWKVTLSSCLLSCALGTHSGAGSKVTSAVHGDGWLLSLTDRDFRWTSVRCPLDVFHSRCAHCGRLEISCCLRNQTWFLVLSRSPVIILTALFPCSQLYYVILYFADHVRSEASVCGHSIAEIAGSNFAGGLEVCLLCLLVLWGSGLCDGPIARPGENFWVVKWLGTLRRKGVVSVCARAHTHTHTCLGLRGTR